MEVATGQWDRQSLGQDGCGMPDVGRSGKVCLGDEEAAATEGPGPGGAEPLRQGRAGGTVQEQKGGQEEHLPGGRRCSWATPGRPWGLVKERG